ncbi:hypothetical protein ACFL08_00780 [Patescibacteria group bacterium]
MFKIILNFIDRRESLVIAVLATIAVLLTTPLAYQAVTAPTEGAVTITKDLPTFTITVDKAPLNYRGAVVSRGGECEVDLENGQFKILDPKAERGKIPAFYEIFTNNKLPKLACPSQTSFRITIEELEEMKKRGAQFSS